MWHYCSYEGFWPVLGQVMMNCDFTWSGSLLDNDARDLYSWLILCIVWLCVCVVGVLRQNPGMDWAVFLVCECYSVIHDNYIVLCIRWGLDLLCIWKWMYYVFLFCIVLWFHFDAVTVTWMQVHFASAVLCSCWAVVKSPVLLCVCIFSGCEMWIIATWK